VCLGSTSLAEMIQDGGNNPCDHEVEAVNFKRLVWVPGDDDPTQAILSFSQWN